jgi:Tol biopolymer transport system component
MVFNTQFTQVIYPQQIDEEYIMLMDVTDRLPILQIKGFHPTGAPQWSHDGTFFVIDLFPDAVYNEHQGINWPYTSGKDLFRISQDGDIQRLTYFTDQYYAKELMYSLSPDERYVAFWLSLSGDISDPSLSSELSVLDLVTGEVTNLCLMTSGAAIQPIWSPDGNYIIANVNDESNIVLVDWKNGLVSNILLVDGIAQAWMDSN